MGEDEEEDGDGEADRARDDAAPTLAACTSGGKRTVVHKTFMNLFLADKIAQHAVFGANEVTPKRSLIRESPERL